MSCKMVFFLAACDPQVSNVIIKAVEDAIAMVSKVLFQSFQAEFQVPTGMDSSLFYYDFNIIAGVMIIKYRAFHVAGTSDVQSASDSNDAERCNPDYSGFHHDMLPNGAPFI